MEYLRFILTYAWMIKKKKPIRLCMRKYNKRVSLNGSGFRNSTERTGKLTILKIQLFQGKISKQFVAKKYE